MEELRATEAQLRAQLAEVQAALKDSEVIGLKEIRTQVADQSNETRWKAYILKEKGVVDNLVDILDDMYPTFLDNEMLQECFTNEQILTVIGKRWSLEWDAFVVNVLKIILDPKDFDDEVTFDDTAGGQDEGIWEAAYDVIKAALT